MTYRQEKEKENIFAISCADWEMVVKAANSEEACTKALERMLNEFGKSVKISPAMLALNFSEFSMDLNAGDATRMVSSASILANAGHHDWAKTLNNLTANNHDTTH